MQPQLPAQPNPNPNNKSFHQLETVNIPTYSLSPVPCNDICLRLGKIVEPVIIEDAPPSVHKEGVSPQHPPNIIPIIEDAEHPLDGTAETSNDKYDNT